MLRIPHRVDRTRCDGVGGDPERGELPCDRLGQPVHPRLGGDVGSAVVDVARKYAHRIDRSRVPAVSAWTKDIAKRVDHDPEGKKLKAV